MLKFIEKFIRKDPFSAIFDANASEGTFSQAIHEFQSLSMEKQKDLSEKTFQKLNKRKITMNTLSLMVFCDFLSTTNPEFCFALPGQLLLAAKQKSKVRSSPTVKQEKEIISFNNFVYFYIQFLELKIWSKLQYEGTSSLVSGMQYFENALESMKIFLKYDFVVQYCLASLKKTKLFKIASQNILRRISEDLGMMTKFVDKWSHVILDQNDNSFRMNKIYEQLIYVSKNVDKFQWIKRKVNIDVEFPKYRVDKEMNRAIEKKMLQKHMEKVMFYSERIRKTETSQEIVNNKILIKEKKTKLMEEEDATEAQIFFNAKKLI